MPRQMSFPGHPLWCIRFTTIAAQLSSGPAQTPSRLFMLTMLLALSETCFGHGQVLQTDWLSFTCAFYWVPWCKPKDTANREEKGERRGDSHATGISFPWEPTISKPSGFVGAWPWEWWHKKKGNIPPPCLCTLQAHAQLVAPQVLLNRAAAWPASPPHLPVPGSKNNLIPLFLLHIYHHMKSSGSTTSA